MSKIAFIFPGQGAQYTGMGRDFYEQTETGRKVFDQASELLGFSMPELVFEPNDRLDITEYTQAAMVTTSIAMMKVFTERTGIRPDVAAGLSLGEYCALAVLGMEASAIEEVLASMDDVQIANYNCPGQIVISGKKEAVEAAAESLKAAGAKRVIPLKVSGPFHSRMLTEAGKKLGQVLENVSVSKPQIPYVANVTAQYVTDAESVKPLLEKQVSSSVRWQQSVEMMIADGVDTFIEIGPGKTLSGFMKKINRNVTVLNIEKMEDVEVCAECLQTK